MRHFVYLDTDILNSYLSQINEGLDKIFEALYKDTLGLNIQYLLIALMQ